MYIADSIKHNVLTVFLFCSWVQMDVYVLVIVFVDVVLVVVELFLYTNKAESCKVLNYLSCKYFYIM